MAPRAASDGSTRVKRAVSPQFQTFYKMHEYSLSNNATTVGAKDSDRGRGNGHMPSSMVRKRVVTFRLSADEYDLIREFCQNSGIRSVSDLARDAILQRIAAANSPRAFVPGDLVSLSSALEQIDVALRELSGRISKVLGPIDRKFENREPPIA